MIGIVTDSNSQITPELVARYGVEVVPLTVTVDGVDHLEGVDLDADGFYRLLDSGQTPTVSTSQPAPGRFAAAYARSAARGCTEIVSIHIASQMSGTVGSATLAAAQAPVPVRVIDTGSASFGVSACVWAAGQAIADGVDAAGVAKRIDALVPLIGTAFMIGVPLLAQRGGRTDAVDLDAAGISVLAMNAGRLELLDRVTTVDDTIDVMATYAAGWADRVGRPVTVALGVADAPSRPLAARLGTALRGLSSLTEVIEYRVGPSVGAHTGPGTFGLFVFPTP